MKTLMQFAIVLFALSSTAIARAEYDPTNEIGPVEPEARFQVISSSIEHSDPELGTTYGCCDVDIKLRVTYTENGQTYQKYSSTKTISPGGSDVFTVQIGINAVVTEERFEFFINGTLIGIFDYTSTSSGGDGQNGVGLCSACASTSEVILWSAPNGAGALKYFWFSFLV